MFKWAQGALASVAGTAEPIYGAEAFQSVVSRANGANLFSELTADDYKWIMPEQSHVETSTFYITANSGHQVMCQIIHSKVNAFNIFAQFTCKVWHPTDKSAFAWSSTNLDTFSVDSATKASFSADHLTVTLSEDREKYIFSASINPKTIVNVTFHRQGPDLKITPDGYSLYGEDHQNPWGSMRHVFWPRTTVTGTIIANGIQIDAQGLGFYVHALQGMKPHHAACKWNFANFQGPSASAFIMEFTTPPSYGSQTVSIGGIVTVNNDMNGDVEFTAATAENQVQHTSSRKDEETGWDQPTAISFSWKGKTREGVAIEASAETDLVDASLVERVDVLAEIPAMVKAFIAGVAGTRPFIYQYCNPVKLNIRIGDEQKTDDTILFNEATFIS